MANGRNFDPNDAKQIALEIEKIYNRLGLSNPFEQGVHTLSELKNGLDEAREILMDWEDGVGDIAKGFKSILNEVNATSNSFNSAKRNLTSLSNISSQLLSHQLGINQLSSKQLIQLKSKLDSELKSLRVNAEALQQEKDELEVITNRSTAEQTRYAKVNTLLANANGLLQEKESIQNRLNEKLEQEIYQRETIEKKLGVVGGLLRGISRIPILGDLVDTNEALQVAESTIETTKSSVRGLGAALGNLGKQTITGLLNPANMVLSTFTLIGSILKEIDSSSGNYAKSMNVTYSEALKVKEEMSSIAVSSNDISLTSTKLMETLSFVGNQLGMNAQLNKADLVTMTKLREKAGLTNEELMGTLSLSLANGKSFKSNANSIVEATKSVNKQKGLYLNTKDILKDISKVSAATTLSLGKNPDAIAKTVATAKALGIELSKLEGIAESLLNFESSIEAELSAELLIGRNINLEQARLLALNNDIAGMAEEISKQFGTSADFSNMNRIQQEAIAKAVGMNRDELAQTLFTQEQLRGLSKDEQSRREKILQQRISEVGLAQAQREIAQEGGLEQMEQQQSIAESFANNISLLKEMATNLLTALNPVLSIIQEILSHTTLVKAVFGAIAGVYIGKIALGLASILPKLAAMLTLNLSNAAAATVTAEAMTLGGATIPILAGLAAIGAAIGAFSSMKDGIIDPKKGPILSGEFGSVQLDPRDKAMYGADGKIKVGTNLAGTPTATTQDNSALIAEIRAMRNELNNRPVVVHSVVKTENNDVLARGTNSANRKSYSIQ